MYKLCKTEESAARQRQLELGLLEMMQTVPYHNISITDLCARLQIPRKAFYRYFSDREGALYSLIDHTLMEYEAYTHPNPREKRTATGDLEKFYLFWKSQKPLLDALSRSQIEHLLVQRTIQQTVTNGTIPLRFVASDPEDVKHHVIRFALQGMMAMVFRWHSNGFSESAGNLAVLTARILTKPLFSSGEFT